MTSSRGSSWPRDQIQVSRIAGGFFTNWTMSVLGLVEIKSLILMCHDYLWLCWNLSEKWKCQLLSCVQLFVMPWTVAHQATLSMGFPGKNTGVGCHVLLLGNLPDPGLKPGSPALQADSLPSEPPGEAQIWEKVTFRVKLVKYSSDVPKTLRVLLLFSITR